MNSLSLKKIFKKFYSTNEMIDKFPFFKTIGYTNTNSVGSKIAALRKALYTRKLPTKKDKRNNNPTATLAFTGEDQILQRELRSPTPPRFNEEDFTTPVAFHDKNNSQKKKSHYYKKAEKLKKNMNKYFGTNLEVNQTTAINNLISQTDKKKRKVVKSEKFVKSENKAPVKTIQVINIEDSPEKKISKQIIRGNTAISLNFDSVTNNSNLIPLNN